jgi:hypothetical protein
MAKRSTPQTAGGDHDDRRGMDGNSGALTTYAYCVYINDLTTITHISSRRPDDDDV